MYSYCPKNVNQIEDPSTVRASCKCNEFINERDINCTYECAEIQNNVSCFSDMHDVCLNSFRFLSRTWPEAHQSIKYK